MSRPRAPGIALPLPHKFARTFSVPGVERSAQARPFCLTAFGRVRGATPPEPPPRSLPAPLTRATPHCLLKRRKSARRRGAAEAQSRRGAEGRRASAPSAGYRARLARASAPGRRARRRRDGGAEQSSPSIRSSSPRLSANPRLQNPRQETTGTDSPPITAVGPPSSPGGAEAPGGPRGARGPLLGLRAIEDGHQYFINIVGLPSTVALRARQNGSGLKSNISLLKRASPERAFRGFMQEISKIIS